MRPERITVFLPCHSLDDFPTWLDESDADALLAAWTAAWHPALIAEVGSAPWWASVDLPPVADGRILGIVPAPWDDRFATQADAIVAPYSRWVRGQTGRDAIVAAAAAALADVASSAAPPPDGGMAADFHALGLATLLAELLGRRMRSHAPATDDDFNAAVVAAAQAALAGDRDVARGRLAECYGCLEAARARYYPVDVWLLDLVLLAESTLGAGLDRELDSPVPLAVVATGQVVEKLAAENPAALRRLRSRMAAGTLEAAGGRYDSRPLDACVPEEILDSFARGMTAWRNLVGSAPTTYAQCTGGSSAILPQLLAGLGFTGAVWPLFDGTPLPDPGAGRIRWEGTGGGCIDGIARPPLDARAAKSILSLPGRIGDAMDHDHTVVVHFAHHAGTACQWHDELRRIGAASTALGTFVTPRQVFAKTEGTGTTVSFEPDAFPIMSATAAGDAVAGHVAAARDEAARLLAARAPLPELLPPAAGGPTATVPRARVTRGSRWLPAVFSGGRRDEGHVLEHGLLRVQVHPRTGGILSVRRPDDRGNRLSQRLSIRSTRPAPAVGQPWEDPAERAEHADMEAESIERVPAADGAAAIVSHGRLRLGQRELGRFTQRVALVAGLPLAVVDIDVRCTTPPTGPLWEHHAACRFAWHENDDVEVRRSLHTQSVATERGRLTAPWFIELADPGLSPRAAAGGEPSAGVTILTGGLPWHVRSGGHMLDSILPVATASAGPSTGVRLGVGVGLERPWEAALSLLAAATPVRVAAGPEHVRLTVGPVRYDGGRLVAARVGLLESRGRAGEARIEWRHRVVRAVVCDVAGRELPAGGGAGPVVVDGRVTTVFLRRYEWLHIDLEFSP
jgi:hypothetical protein